MDRRDGARHLRQLERGAARAEQRQRIGGLLLDRRDHTLQHAVERLQSVEVVADETLLDIQRDELVDMARSVVWLGPKCGADLEDTLEHADHDLLVELWTLR